MQNAGQMPVAGDVFANRYRIDSVIGEGGFAVVFKAWDPRAKSFVALKVLKNSADRSVRARFELELAALARLQNPATVRLLGHGQSDNSLFAVFEYLDGHELADVLNQRGRLEVGQVETVLRQLLEALDEAHTAGILHRDLKPENIIVVDDTDAMRVKLIDFGIARPLDGGSPSVTRTGELVGTPRYMSPEQLTGAPLTPTSDLYSLGMIAFEMALGRQALQGGAWVDQLERLQTGHLFSVPALDRMGPLRAVITRLCARKAEERYPSARAALSALDRRSPSAPSKLAPRDSRWQLLAALAALAVLGLLLLPDSSPSTSVKTPVERVSATALLKSAPEQQQARDPAPNPEVPAHVGSRGCGAALAPGRTEFSALLGLQPASVVGVVPEGYAPNKPQPLIIAFHEGHQSPDSTIEELQLIRLADRLGSVVVVPNGEVLTKGSWRVNIEQIVSRAREVAEHEACIDPDRVVLLGHGAGSRGALVASCAAPYAALVMTHYRLDIDEVPCTPAAPVPTLYTFVDFDYMKSLPDCTPPEHQMSVSNLVELWRGRQSCSSSSTPRSPEHGTCRDWACDTPLTTCTVTGGPHWRRSGEGYGRCDGPASPFDYHAEIERFLEPTIQPQ